MHKRAFNSPPAAAASSRKSHPESGQSYPFPALGRAPETPEMGKVTLGLFLCAAPLQEAQLCSPLRGVGGAGEQQLSLVCSLE